MTPFAITPIGKPEQWLIEAAAEIGLDFSKLIHEITSDFINHCIKRHGQGAVPITFADFEKIPDIIAEPDMTIIGAHRGGVLFNIYTKRIDGETFLYFEEILDSRRNKALRSRTFYKIVKPLTLEAFEKIVTMNEKTDVAGVKKVIATGGHPGG